MQSEGVPLWRPQWALDPPKESCVHSPNHSPICPFPSPRNTCCPRPQPEPCDAGKMKRRVKLGDVSSSETGGILLRSRECPWSLGRLWEGDAQCYQPLHKLCDTLRGGPHAAVPWWAEDWQAWLERVMAKACADGLLLRTCDPGQASPEACGSGRRLNSASSQAVRRARAGERADGGVSRRLARLSQSQSPRAPPTRVLVSTGRSDAGPRVSCPKSDTTKTHLWASFLLARRGKWVGSWVQSKRLGSPSGL